MKIIDTHQHLGQSQFSGVVTTETDLIRAMDQHGITLSLVMPQPTQEDITRVHDRIAEACRCHPGRLRGLASISPWWSEKEYKAEARRCIQELGFVGIKLHPLGHNLPPTHSQADKVFRSALELGVPVIVHTGIGSPWALPSLCIPPARRYTELAIVLAHAGWGVYSSEAMVAAEVCPNMCLEPSWCPTYMVRQMLDRFGPRRVLFGSDHLSNLPVELAKYRSIALNDQELQTVLSDTAQDLFGLHV